MIGTGSLVLVSGLVASTEHPEWRQRRLIRCRWGLAGRIGWLAHLDLETAGYTGKMRKEAIRRLTGTRRSLFGWVLADGSLAYGLFLEESKGRRRVEVPCCGGDREDLWRVMELGFDALTREGGYRRRGSHNPAIAFSRTAGVWRSHSLSRSFVMDHCAYRKRRSPIGYASFRRDRIALERGVWERIL